ncbi:MAG: glycosyltransferase family 1 protein [Alphaproteobacteria bacterium]|nr:glycosyltransferase family 1 protein [Alphaproteobacteria bacterium]
MNIILDNIIFSLQKAGGISNHWSSLIQNIHNDNSFNPKFIEYNNATQNFFRKKINIKQNLIISKNKNFLQFKRYCNFKTISQEKHIFHSSYYRTEKNNAAVNITTVFDFIYEHFRNGLPKRIHSWQKTNAILNSKSIICISQSTKNDLLKFYPNLKSKLIHVIYCDINVEFKPIQLNVPFDKKHHFEDFSYAIFVGDHQTSYKNFNIAIEACNLLNKKLLIVGGGKLNKHEINLLNNSLGSNNYQSILNVSVQDLNQYYNRAYCLLYPSSYEGFGIPVVEAQKAGCPVVATHSASIPEVIGNIVCAVKNPLPQNIAKIMKSLQLNSQFRQETIAMGFEKASMFKTGDEYRNTKDFYLESFNH